MAAREKYSIKAQWLNDEMAKIPIDTSAVNIVKGLIKKAEETIDWYWVGKTKKRRAAVPLRFISLFIAGIGAVLPIIDSIEWGNIKDGLGFKYSVLMFVIAGAINLFDRFFGLSSGWMRYTLTAMKMEKALGSFVIDISELLVKKGGNINLKILEKSRKFSNVSFDILISETSEWAREFRKSISDIEKTIKSKSK